jgi:hypothetical protein
MKKIIFGLSLMFFMTVVGFAADFSVSAGFGGDFGLVFTTMDTNIPQPLKGQLEDVLGNIDQNRVGVFGFLDLTYFELNFGGKFYNFTYKESGISIKETDSYFDLGLLLKYPFQITEKFALFPLLGFDYQILLKSKVSSGGLSVEIDRSDLSDNGYDETYYDRWVINLGIGMDFNITDWLFIRSEIQYGVNLNTKSQKDTIDLIESYGYDLFILNHGPSIKLALGFKFF